MASFAPTSTPGPASASLWTGRVLSGLAAVFLLVDAGTKLALPGLVAAQSPEIGWSLDPGTMRLLGTLLLVPTLLYVWPCTSVLGAVLITGYLGGAIATHLRIDSALLTHTLFGVYLGLMVWGGLWLRHPALRSVFPFDTRKD